MFRFVCLELMRRDQRPTGTFICLFVCLASQRTWHGHKPHVVRLLPAQIAKHELQHGLIVPIDGLCGMCVVGCSAAAAAAAGSGIMEGGSAGGDNGGDGGGDDGNDDGGDDDDEDDGDGDGDSCASILVGRLVAAPVGCLWGVNRPPSNQGS